MSSHYFIGIKAPSTIHKHVEYYRNKFQLAYSYKVIPALDDLHITLLFNGALTDQQRDSLQQQLEGLSKNHQPFSLSINGLSYFGSPTGPRVVYLSVEPSKELNSLQQSISSLSNNLFDNPAIDRFTAHITIAKKRKTSEKSTIIHKENFQSVDFVVQHFSLFTIHPTQSPKYEAIQNYFLQETLKQ